MDGDGDDAPSGSLAGLGRADRLVVFGLRAAAFGRADCPTVRRAFLDRMGPRGEGVLGHLLVFVRLMAASARRRLALHAPGCVCLCETERTVLEALAAAQRGDADEAVARSALTRLLGAPPGESLMTAARALAEELGHGGLRLSGHDPYPTPAAIPSPRPTLH